MAARTNCLPNPRVIIVCCLVLLLTSESCVRAQDDGEIPRIGVIGAGIGGTSAAYFLRQAFGDKLEVDVFETDRIGGRLAVINIDGLEYEAGGSVIHPKNEYMGNFTQQFGLEQKSEENGGRMGMFSSEEGLFFQTSTWSPVTMAKLFWRYGWDLKRIQDWVAELLVSFRKIYDYQQQGMAFTTVEDLLKAMDEQFVNYTHYTVRTVLRDAGFSDIFIDELATGAFRDNYSQMPGIHGFVGAVSLAGVEHGLWSVRGGNKNVAEELLKASKANLVRGTVTHVFHTKSDGGTVSYEVQYEKAGAASGDEDSTSSREYDLLVIAAPLKSGSKSKIRFEEFPNELRLPDMPYHTTEAAFVHGKPNASFFGVGSAGELPHNIMTTDSDVFFNKVVKLTPVTQVDPVTGGKTEDEDGFGVWKAFFNRVPTEAQLKLLFESHKDLRLLSWVAYPEYEPNMQLPSFVLHDRLYHINAIEAAASAMEMSVIGAKNVALLAYNQWFSHFDKIDELLFSAVEEGEGRRPDEL